jgi:hypothetical protein
MPRVSSQSWQQLGLTKWNLHAEQFMEESFSAGLRDLTDAQALALQTYQGSDAGMLNAALRYGGEWADQVSHGVPVADHVAELRGMIAQQHSTVDRVLFRGVEENRGFEQILAQLQQPGDVLKDPGFVSLSAAHEVAETFNGLAIFEIEVPAGTPALVMPAPTAEAEVVLAPGSSFELVSVRGNVYRVRYIGVDKI